MDIEQIKSAIKRLNLKTIEPNVDVPLERQAIELAHFARDYIAAASVVTAIANKLGIGRASIYRILSNSA